MQLMENPAFTEKISRIARETGFHLYDAVYMEAGTACRAVYTPANACNNSYSVAKVFTMTAIGMLAEAGRLSVHDKICDILAPTLPKPSHESWRNVEIHHALRHEMGLGRENMDVDIDTRAGFASEDYLDEAMAEPLPYAPGTHYRYSDTAFYILSRVVSAVTGEKLHDFLRPRLFNPLGFSEMAWSICPLGYTIGATGLYIRTLDMAKLGLLYAQGGVYEGKRLISEEWVRFALENDYELHKIGACRGKGGMRAQYLAYHPEKKCVLAWHAYEEAEKPADTFIARAIPEILEA